MKKEDNRTAPDTENGPASVPPPSLAAATPKDDELLMPTPEEEARYQEAQQPGYQPTPPEPKPLPEKVERAAKTVNKLYGEGKRRITSAQVGKVLQDFGWFPMNASFNGVGDSLGKSGLRLQVVGHSGASIYLIPEGGITRAYLRRIGFDV